MRSNGSKGAGACMSAEDSWQHKELCCCWKESGVTCAGAGPLEAAGAQGAVLYTDAADAGHCGEGCPQRWVQACSNPLPLAVNCALLPTGSGLLTAVLWGGCPLRWNGAQCFLWDRSTACTWGALKVSGVSAWRAGITGWMARPTWGCARGWWTTSTAMKASFCSCSPPRLAAWASTSQAPTGVHLHPATLLQGHYLCVQHCATGAFKAAYRAVAAPSVQVRTHEVGPHHCTLCSIHPCSTCCHLQLRVTSFQPCSADPPVGPAGCCCMTRTGTPRQTCRRGSAPGASGRGGRWRCTASSPAAPSRRRCTTARSTSSSSPRRCDAASQQSPGMGAAWLNPCVFAVFVMLVKSYCLWSLGQWYWVSGSQASRSESPQCLLQHAVKTFYTNFSSWSCSVFTSRCCATRSRSASSSPRTSTTCSRWGPNTRARPRRPPSSPPCTAAWRSRWTPTPWPSRPTALRPRKQVRPARLNAVPLRPPLSWVACLTDLDAPWRISSHHTILTSFTCQVSSESSDLRSVIICHR